MIAVEPILTDSTPLPRSSPVIIAAIFVTTFFAVGLIIIAPWKQFTSPPARPIAPVTQRQDEARSQPPEESTPQRRAPGISTPSRRSIRMTPTDSGPIELGANHRRRILSRKLPEFPEWFEQMGGNAEVMFEIEIAPDGSIKTARLLASSGHEDLDDRARRSVESWIYEERPGVTEIRRVVVRFAEPDR